MPHAAEADMNPALQGVQLIHKLYAMRVHLHNAIFTTSNKEFIVCSESATVGFVLESSELSSNLPCYSIVDDHLYSSYLWMLCCNSGHVQYEGNQAPGIP